ncbi:olfactory receptor 4N5-like [Ictidomys tridecemlineatus]|uniref:olfactory receptor 4N5-like n=1 Tax=Ictidomys tridecemlineatus TaxID=43179 RepID=UPI000B548CA5|nr:olfactory receptor 4N5-like [Ictidomys tridecemlineatus]KAG3261502.1 olfactory receptor 4N5-like [Ictidomys tridecemlineatus]
MQQEVVDTGNSTVVTEFILLALTQSQDSQILLFVLVSIFYLIILSGNVLIILNIRSDPGLNAPPYFFLGNLAFLDASYSFIVAPRMLMDFFSEKKVISYRGCITQQFFLHFLGAGEMFLLVVMAFDRYIAICRPLHYATVMSPRVCYALLLASWAVGFIHTTSQMVFTVGLPFCGPNVVDSIFCDLPLVIKLACTDTYILELLVIVDSGLLSLVCFILLVISYIIMFITLWQHSSSASSKAVSTLSAHITVVTLFFGPGIFIYAFPFNSYSVDKFLSVFYSIMTPFLNPIIYTLRNQEMKAAIKRLSSQQIGFCVFS